MRANLSCQLFSVAHGMNLKTLADHANIKIGQICHFGTVKSNTGHKSLDYAQTTPLFPIPWYTIIYTHTTT